ncbi:hypothetical protein M378DRAFT_399472 [Amanita muscaria Koide BX008]|uniref:Uncharacterized protein n=1 Tax=Amanita muscaria (strain Koide BX008) TaxID=946122 RepID=A0A0C2ST36_AMAMK|nr:hypothetical protein M378DRAFT_399472 [Amanita muscaria Koide BX008]
MSRALPTAPVSRVSLQTRVAGQNESIDRFFSVSDKPHINDQRNATRILNDSRNQFQPWLVKTSPLQRLIRSCPVLVPHVYISRRGRVAWTQDIGVLDRCPQHVFREHC